MKKLFPTFQIFLSSLIRVAYMSSWSDLILPDNHHADQTIFSSIWTNRCDQQSCMEIFRADRPFRHSNYRKPQKICSKRFEIRVEKILNQHGRATCAVVHFCNLDHDYITHEYIYDAVEAIKTHIQINAITSSTKANIFHPPITSGLIAALH